MCMLNLPRQVDIFLKEKKDVKFVWAYKVVCKLNDKLLSPFFMSVVPEYKPGIYESNSRATKPCKQEKDIGRGIHVCLNIREAENLVGQFVKGSKMIIKVKCEIADLIGVGRRGFRAVFKKIYIPDSEYKKAIQ